MNKKGVEIIMKRKYIQPRADIVNLASTTSFLEGSTLGGANDSNTEGSDPDDFTEVDDGNAPADPWA